MDVREKLVELLDDFVSYEYNTEELVDELIDHGVTVQEWISVKDRLPEDNKEVLIYCGSYHELGWYESDNKSWRSDFLGCCTDDITHWMPLPQPPKGE